ncbi:MAG: hypothetical protein U0271_25000 [Polyangiaceae bacterium]
MQATSTVSLEQYAGVTTALAEGFARAEVLAQEQILEPDWNQAAADWPLKLAEEPALLDELARLRARAEDALFRKIEPLHSDPAVWVGLLRALVFADDPNSVLGPLGLTLGDLSRARRVWDRRCALDPQIPETLKRLAKTELPAPTKLSVDARKLRGFPWSPKKDGAALPQKKSEEQKRAASNPRLTGRPGETPPVAFDIDLYAALSVILELWPTERALALALCGLDEAGYLPVEGDWTSRARYEFSTRADLEVRRADYRALFGRVREGAKPIIG